MKALCLYLHVVLYILQNEIWKFGRNLLLAKFASERVKLMLNIKGILPEENAGSKFSHDLISLDPNYDIRCPKSIFYWL